MAHLRIRNVGLFPISKVLCIKFNRFLFPRRLPLSLPVLYLIFHHLQKWHYLQLYPLCHYFLRLPYLFWFAIRITTSELPTALCMSSSVPIFLFVEMTSHKLPSVSVANCIFIIRQSLHGSISLGTILAVKFSDQYLMQNISRFRAQLFFSNSIINFLRLFMTEYVDKIVRAQNLFLTKYSYFFK